MMHRALAAVVLVSSVILPSRAGGTDLSEDLLDMGDYAVGFTQEVETRDGRDVEFLVWYPAVPDPEAESAVYTLRTPTASTTTLTVLGTLDSHWVADAIEGDVPVDGGPHEPLPAADVYDGLDAATGPFPVHIHLPGGGAPGILHHYEGAKYASQGIVFVSITLVARAVFCDFHYDSDFVLDTVLGWNDDPDHVLYGALDVGAVSGGGWSFGGRTWLARTSTTPECEMPVEDRVTALFLKDATREALTVAQIEGNDVDTMLSSQYCRPLQIDLHELLASRPPMMMLQGYTPLPSSANHTLFAQGCMVIRANQLAGNPDFAPPPVLVLCADARFRKLERFFAAQNSRYGIAFAQSAAGEVQYESVLASGQITDEGFHVMKPRSSGTGHTANDFCGL